MFLGVITTSIISLASVQSSVLPSANVSVDLDWSTFLARHDMLWSWTWGAHGVSTIRTRSTDLEHCGPGGSPGACCIEAPVAMDAANVRAAAAPRTRTRTPTHRAPFTGFVQLALVSPTQRGCSPSAVPPGECCMPVVWSNSDKMSGCHAVDDTRWDFNQFFTVRLPPAPHAANGSATSTDTIFQLRSRGSKQLCLTLAATSPQSTKGNNHSRSAASGLAGALCDDSFSQHEQLWQLRGDAVGVREGGPAQIESVAAIHTGRAMCLHAIDGREAGGFTIATCSNTTELSLSDNTLQHQLWSPLCSNGSAGAEPVPGWPCVTRDVPTPAPPPTPTPASPIKLAACNASSPTQQWLALSNGSLISVSRGLCLTYSSAPSPTFLAQCRDGDDTQMWNVDDGFLTAGKSKVPTVTASGVNSSHSLRSDAPQLCLQAATGQPFCNGTICPAALAQLFVTDTPLAIAECHNGDRSMLFATQVIRDDLDANAEQSIVSSEENLVPLTWATSAYVGNGALGVRIAAEAGEGGVLRFFCDNVLLGAGSHRQATGYFRLITSAGATAAGKPPARAVHVSMRQHLKDARLTVNISDSTTGSNLIELDLFVNANYTTSAAASGAPEGQGAAVLQVRWRDGALPAAPALEWVAAPKSQPKMWWLNTTSRASTGEHILTAYISVVSSSVADAVAVVNAARNAGRDALLRASSAWWATYWDQAFVALPFTRMEGLYYAEMYRFAASDRITLHGLMGAIGPTGIFNLWPDDVWDMNEQVMYWISAASNRPQISEPMCEYVETNGVTAGGLWMIHQYVKQARFDGRDDRLRDHAWSIIVGAVKQQAGGARTSPGTLKKLSGTADDGRYHIVGCSSPEYRCYPPFETLACTTTRDCNFGLAQLRWGLATALELTQRFALDANLTAAGVDVAWWRALAGNGSEASGELAWYPYDVDTGFRLDASCSFDCPHRHFSHLLQLYDLESVRYDSAINPGNSTCSAVNETLNALVHRSIDRWYRLTCDPANWFNEECRGFTHCGFAAMSAVSGRPDAAAGNLSELLDTLITPNAMYGEMVYQSNPGEFAPVSESAYCAAGVLHEMLLHTHKDSNDGGDNGVLQIFPGIPDADPRWANASFHEIRASGALLVSASREEGSLQWVAVLSERGGTVRLSVPRDVAWNVPSNSPAVEPVGATRVSSTESSIYGRTVWTFVLGQGQRVVLYVGAAPAPGFIVTPQRTNASELNFFGFRRQMKPLH